MWICSFALTFPPFRHKRSGNYVYISTVHHNLVCPLCNLSRTMTNSSVLTFMWLRLFHDLQFLVCGFFSSNTSLPFASFGNLPLFQTVSDNSCKNGTNSSHLHTTEPITAGNILNDKILNEPLSLTRKEKLIS